MAMNKKLEKSVKRRMQAAADAFHNAKKDATSRQKNSDVSVKKQIAHRGIR